MEDWLAAYKDSCIFNLGESGMPNISVGELLTACGETPDVLSTLVLKDNDTRGTERLRCAICESYSGDVPFEHITVTTGTSEALFILFNILCEKRTAVVTPLPSFQALYEVPSALGAELKPYRMRSENGFVPDPDEVCALMNDSTAAVVLNTPHNPSGATIPDEVARMIIARAERHGAVVISDEHYRFLPHEGDWPLKTLARSDGRVVATGSITKCFGVIGLRMGWIAAPESLVSGIRDFRDYLTHTLSPVSDFLAACALENAGNFVEPGIEMLRKNRIALRTAVDDTRGLSLVTPQAGVVAFPGYDYPIPSDDFAHGLIHNHGVFVLPGSSFEVERHFRINLGQDPVEFQNALTHIHNYCRTLG